MSLNTSSKFSVIFQGILKKKKQVKLSKHFQLNTLSRLAKKTLVREPKIS